MLHIHNIYTTMNKGKDKLDPNMGEAYKMDITVAGINPKGHN